jgi:membrane associated rhomboid family serine protease
MIPLRDTIRSRTFPVITIAIIVVNALFFFFQLWLGPALNVFIQEFGLIPAKYFWFSDNRPTEWGDRFFPFLSSMFLHGGWMHVIGNMWNLWIFGDNVEDRLGHGGFIAFYLGTGLAAGLAHVYLNAGSPVPTIGASGAISGVMGAYFMLYPRSRVLTLVPIFIFIQIIEIPAVFFLGFWFLLQFFQGTASIVAGETLGGVAWWAHLGGFAAGAVVALVVKLLNLGRRSIEVRHIHDDWE